MGVARGHIAHRFPGRWIEDRVGGAGRGGDPLAIDEVLVQHEQNCLRERWAKGPAVPGEPFNRKVDLQVSEGFRNRVKRILRDPDRVPFMRVYADAW